MTSIEHIGDHLCYAETAYQHVSRIVEYPNRDLAKLMFQIPLSKPILDKVFGKPIHRGQIEDKNFGQIGRKDDCYYLQGKLLAELTKTSSVVSLSFEVGTTKEEVFEILSELVQHRLVKQWVEKEISLTT